MPGKYLLIIEDTPEEIEQKIAKSIQVREELFKRPLTDEEKKKLTIKIKAKIRKGER